MNNGNPHRPGMVEAARRRVVNMLDAHDLTELCRDQGFEHVCMQGISAMRRHVVDRWDAQTTKLVLDLMERTLNVEIE